MRAEQQNIEKRILMTRIKYFFYKLNLEYDEFG